MRTVATALVFGRSMDVVSVDGYETVPENYGGPTTYATVTVAPDHESIRQIVVPSDLIVINVEELTGQSLREAYALSDCVICREMAPLRCDVHATPKPESYVDVTYQRRTGRRAGYAWENMN